MDMLGTLFADARYALRSMGRRPVFAATAILTLALGIGANVSIYTVVDGFLFSPLPYERPDELVSIYDQNPELGWTGTDVSPANAWDWRARSPALADLAVFTEDGFNLTGDGPPELVSGIRTSPNLLQVLGRAPSLGRDFREDEVGEGHDRVAILTDGFWDRRFGRDRNVLGSTLTLDGTSVTVIGILPASFRFLDERIDLMVPLQQHPAESDRDSHYANTVARLAPGATVEQARAELTDVAARLAEEYPEANDGWTVEVRSTHADLVGDVARQASFVLLGAVGFVLLMACVNVANLLLARAGGRRQEMSVRAALGAGRTRIVRQLLTESLVLALAGGALGILLAVWGYRAIVAGLPSQIPPVFQFGMDAPVFAFAIGVSLVAAVLFGVAPALSATRGMMTQLRGGGRGGRSRRAGRLGNTLVVIQTAMAVVLLIGGGLLMKSLAAMRDQDFGFDPDNVIAVRISPPSGDYPEADDARAFWDAVERRVRELPSVVAVGTTQSHPLMGSNWGGTIRIAGQDTPDDTGRRVRFTYATPGLFDALRLQVVRGRGLNEADAADAPRVAVVNETFVRRYLPDDRDPLSASILIGDGAEDAVPIVGVIHDVIERAVDRAPEPSLYASLSQNVTWTRSLVVRTARDPAEAVPAIQQAVWSVDPAIPLYDIETMQALLERRLGGFTVIGYLMATFAALSLALGAVGIYGVTAYAAGQRTSEIGLRLAMGAERAEVIRMVVAQGAWRAGLGLAIGLGVAFLTTGAMSSILIGVRRGDPATFLGVTAILGLVAMLALYLPARRAARVDPVRALSVE
jgi:putative ABC transport system permease protein